MSSTTEISAAEQAAWHAGLDEGRVQGYERAMGRIHRSEDAIQSACERRDLPVQIASARLLAAYVFEQQAESATFTIGELHIDAENTGDWEITVTRLPAGGAPGA